MSDNEILEYETDSSREQSEEQQEQVFFQMNVERSTRSGRIVKPRERMDLTCIKQRMKCGFYNDGKLATHF